MPHYFFHLVLDDKTLTDDEGQDLDTLAEARVEAEAIIRELAGNHAHAGNSFLFELVRIADENDRVVGEVLSTQVLEGIFSSVAPGRPT